MTIAWLIFVGEGVAAYLTVDFLFRLMPVESNALRRYVRRFGLIHAGVAALLGVGGAWAQWYAAGYSGLALGALNLAPWWLLWRFGVRKQFPLLYEERSQHEKKPTP